MPGRTSETPRDTRRARRSPRATRAGSAVARALLSFPMTVTDSSPKEARMSLDTLVVVLPIIGLAIGASLGAWAVHWLRENRPAWWPGNRD